MSPRYRRVADLFELTAMLLATSTGVSLDEIAVRFEVSRGTAERMLSSLREIFPETEGAKRDGRVSDWCLPPSSYGALAVLSEVSELSQRVEEMASVLEDEGAATARHVSLIKDVLDATSVGVFILDPDFKVVRTNEALRIYFGLDGDEAHGQDKRELLRNRIRHIMKDGDEFERRILSSYEVNTHIERFDCIVAPGPGPGRAGGDFNTGVNRFAQGPTKAGGSSITSTSE